MKSLGCLAFSTEALVIDITCWILPCEEGEKLPSMRCGASGCSNVLRICKGILACPSSLETLQLQRCRRERLGLRVAIRQRGHATTVFACTHDPPGVCCPGARLAYGILGLQERQSQGLRAAAREGFTREKTASK